MAKPRKPWFGILNMNRYLAAQLRREELTDPYSGGPRPEPPARFTMTAMGPAADARAHQRLEDLRLLAAAPQPKNFIIYGQRLTTDVPAGLRALGLNILAESVEREGLSLEDAKVEDLAVEDLAVEDLGVEDLDDAAPLGHA